MSVLSYLGVFSFDLELSKVEKVKLVSSPCHVCFLSMRADISIDSFLFFVLLCSLSR